MFFKKKVDASYQEFLKFLQALNLKVETLEIQVNSLNSKIKGFDLKWSKFIKNLADEEEEETEKDLKPKPFPFLNERNPFEHR